VGKSTIDVIKVFDYSTLIQILCFWTVSIILFLPKTPSCFHLKNNVSEPAFCLHLQVKPTQLDPIDTAGHPSLEIGSETYFK
jgi:hypothetical protein